MDKIYGGEAGHVEQFPYQVSGQDRWIRSAGGEDIREEGEVNDVDEILTICIIHIRVTTKSRKV